MRLFQRNKRGDIIEELCPIVLCLLIIDACEGGLGCGTASPHRGVARFLALLEHDRDAAKMLRLAAWYAPVEGAGAGGFCTIGALRMGMRAGGGPMLAPEDVERACVQIEGERAVLEASGTEVRHAFVVAVTENPRVAGGVRGQTTVFSLAEEAQADPAHFLEQCALSVLASIDGMAP